TMTWHAARAVERLMLIDLERQQRRRAEALTEINRALTGADDTSALLQVAVSSVRTLLRADLASLAVGSSNGSSAIYTSGATEDELRMLLSGTPPKADVENIQPIDDLTALFDDPHAEFAAYLIGGGARHAVAVPIVHREERIGVVYAWFRHEDAEYCAEDLATIERVLVELSAGLDRVALQASERRERTRAETLLAF